MATTTTTLRKTTASAATRNAACPPATFFSLYGERTPAKSLLEAAIGATRPIHGTRLHAALGRATIGPIHHLALRGLKFEDGRHTLERTVRCALDAAGYTRWREGPMPSIGGEFCEFAPPGADHFAVGLPRDPYVFTSLAYVADLPDPKARQILTALRPYLLFEADLPPTSEASLWRDDNFDDDDDDTESRGQIVHLPLLSADDYDVLKKASQYVAWHVTNTLAVRHGATAKLDAVNHVAYVLNDGSHDALTTCAEMNACLVAKGWTLNTYAGETVQADEDARDGYAFRQSSVVASAVRVVFAGESEPRSIPSIFHEFVEHPMTLPFRGFSNARALFTSTSTVQQRKKAT